MLALSEHIMQEPIPLAAVQAAIFDFCRGRRDLCVFGAQAISQHTRVPRMTDDVELMAEDPEGAARELARWLAERFPHQLAARVRAVKRGDRVLGYRVYQTRSEEMGGNRHLAGARILDVPRDAIEVAGGVQYTGAPLTLAMKLHAATVRSNPLKRDQDRVDARRLILALPDLQAAELQPLWNALGCPPAVRDAFEELRKESLAAPPTDEDDFY